MTTEKEPYPKTVQGCQQLGRWIRRNFPFLKTEAEVLRWLGKNYCPFSEGPNTNRETVTAAWTAENRQLSPDHSCY